MFSRHYLPSEEFISWSLSATSWFVAQLGGFESLSCYRLVRPTREHFPLTEAAGHGRASELFEMVRGHVGLQDWPCRLEQHEDSPSLSVSGSCSLDELNGEHVITYSSRILGDTQGMVATLAHEFCHVLLGGADEPAPGGAAAEEPATDLAAILLGFGIFLANSALRHETEDPVLFGPGGPQGYLDQKQAAFVLALFVRLRKQREQIVAAHLNTDPRSYFGAALGELDASLRGPVEQMRTLVAAPGSRPPLSRRE